MTTVRIKRAPKRHGSTNPGIASFVAKLSDETQTTVEALPQVLSPVVDAGWTWPRTDLQHWINPLNRFDQVLESILAEYHLSSMEQPQIKAFDEKSKAALLAILAFTKLLLENSTNRKIFASFDRLNDLLHTTDLDVLLATLRLALRPAHQFSMTNNGSTSFAISERRLLNLAQGWGTREYGLEIVDLAGETVEIPLELNEVDWQFYKKAPVVSAGLPGPSPSTPAAIGLRKDDYGFPSTSDRRGKGKESTGLTADAMDVEEDGRPVASSSTTQPSTSTNVSTPAPKRHTSFAQGSLLATPIPSTPGPASSSANTLQEGLTTIHLGNVRTSSKSAVELLIEAIEKEDVPESDRLDLLQKIRIAKSLGSPSERRKMLLVRLLSMAIFAHTTTESHVQSRLFLYEPELITQLAELVHPDRSVPIEIQAAAFYTLDALSHFKAKLSEVAAALNASVSHGILMYVFRRTVSDLERDNAVSTQEFVDSLFSLLLYFQTNAFVGNQIVAAGIVSMLVDLIKNQRRDRIWVVTKAIMFLDSLMYGYQTAFTLFISAGGLNIFVERVKLELDLCLEKYRDVQVAEEDVVPTGLLTFEHAALLKSLLRSIQRLMQTSGTTEGLRNLIDTSLLGTVKTILQNRPIFGAQVFALAINITATFVHNEPTCLATIQEAKVPEALYDAIGESIPPSIDVLQAIPNAVGALCLNATGLALFNSRPIITKYFTIFTSEKHVRQLQERDNGTMLGASMDELVRHHPSLKEQVLDAILRTLKTIRDGAASFKPDSPEGYALRVISATGDASSLSDANASSAPSNSAANAAGVDVEMQDSATASLNKPPPMPSDGKENFNLQSIDAFGRFLEGLFQNMSHAKDFARHDPYDLLLDLLALPCMPNYAPGTGAFSSISSIFRMISEFKGVEVVTAVLKRTKAHLDKIDWFTNSQNGESALTSMISPTDETIEQENVKFRDLTVLLSHFALLSDSYSSLSYTHGKLATSVLAVLTTPENAEVLTRMAVVLAVAEKEGWILQGLFPEPTDPDHSIRQTLTTKPITASTTPNPNSVALVSTATAPQGSHAAASTVGESSTSTSPQQSQANSSTPNLRALKEVILAISPNVQPTYQSIIKLLVHRRSNDAAHRTTSNNVANTIAQALTDLLKWPETADLSAGIAYATHMFRHVSSFLFDERSSHSGLQTLLLSTFIKAGGLDAYLALFNKLQDVVSEEVSGGVVEIVTAFGALKIALETLNRLTSHRTILESSQTALLLTRERDRSSPDYFDPHAFLVQLRATILPPVLRMWEQGWLRKSPPNVVRSIVSTLVSILRAEGETSVDPAGGSSNRLLDSEDRGGAALDRMGGALGAILGRGAAAAGPFVLDQTRVAQLVDMGFPRSAVETALTRCRNNIGVATEYLLQHPDLVGAARAREAAQPPAPDVPAPAADAPAQDNGPQAGGEQAQADAVAPQEDDVALEIDIVVGEEEDAPMNEVAAVVDQQVAAAPVVPDPAPETIEKRSRQQIDEENKVIKGKLEASREGLKPAFLPKALSLAEDFGDLVFDIKGVFGLLSAAGEKTPPSLQPLLDDLESSKIDSDNFDFRKSQDSASAIRWRVIALIVGDAGYRETVESSRERVMATLMRFKSEYSSRAPDKDLRPKWLAPAMLVADSLFSIGEVPVPTTILPENENAPAVELVAQGPSWQEERQAWFELTMDVLKKEVSDREVFLSTLRLLLVLTRDHNLASTFVAQDGLNSLLAAFTTERPETTGCRAYVTMILRHVIEDKTTLLSTMEHEIEAWFATPRSKVADITGFLRGTSSIAFRHVPTFLEAVKATCKIVQADANGPYHIALQNETQSNSSKNLDAAEIRSPITIAPEDGPANEGAIDDLATKTPSKSSISTSQQLMLKSVPANVETVMHFLMSLAIDSSRAALTPVPLDAASRSESTQSTATAGKEVVGGENKEQSTSSPLPADPNQKKEGKDAHIPADLPLGDYFQATYALSCIAELVAAYPACKSSFLSFSTRRGGKEIQHSNALPVKPRSSFLHFLLNDLIPIGTISTPSDFESRRRAAVSSVATLVVIALCHDPSPTPLASATKDAHAIEVATLRKNVLDAISRAFRDATGSNEPTETRYGRLLLLSDLCYRLLTSRPFSGMQGKPTDETSMQIAKLMLEKNFAGILTNALADVDLNFPSVHNLINSILRPLELLTKVVTKVGRRPGANASLLGGARRNTALNVDDSSDADSLDEDGDAIEVESDEEEQEPPDLYRNSALGMYEGELEPGNNEDAYMSGESEDYDEDDDMMDEMEDGALPGSDVSDISDDEDEDEVEDAEAMADEMELRDGMDDDDDDSDSDDDGDDHDHDSALDSDGQEGTGDDDDDGDEIIEIVEEVEFDDDDEGEDDDEDGWIDEDDDVNGELVIDHDANAADLEAGFIDNQGNATPLRAGDLDEDEGDHDEDSEDPDSYTDEEEQYLTGELEFDAEMTEQLRAAQQGGGNGVGVGAGGAAFGWDSGIDSGRRSRLSERERCPRCFMLQCANAPALPLLPTDDMMQLTDADIFGPPRRTNNNTIQAAAHPLLVETPASEGRQETASSRRGRAVNGARGTPEYEEWANNIERMLGPGGVDTLQQLLGQHGLAHLSGPDQLRVGIAPGPDGGLAMVIDPTPALQQAHQQAQQGAGFRQAAPGGSSHLRTQHASTASTSRSVARQLVERLGSTSEFWPIQTVSRWQEETRVTQGSVLIAERIARLVNHVINVLHPSARALAKEDKQREQERMKRLESEAAEAEDREAKPAGEQEEIDRLEREFTELEEADSEESMDVESAEAVTTNANPSTSGASAVPVNLASTGINNDDLPADDVQAVMALARSLAAGLAVPSAPTPMQTASPLASTTPASDSQPQGPTPASLEVESTLQPNVSISAASSSSTANSTARPVPMDAEPIASSSTSTRLQQEGNSEETADNDEEAQDTAENGGDDSIEAEDAAQERVVIEIHGRQVDITDTGIDPTFLEALPDDMREEVLNQHFREARATGPPPPIIPAESQIDTTFLEALPPDLRAEVLRQEAAEQRREQAAARARSAALAPEPAADGADPEAFAGLMDPELQEETLRRAAAHRENERLRAAGMPRHLLAEANAILDGRRGGQTRAQGEGLAGVAAALDLARGADAIASGAAGNGKKASPHREAIQLLDKSGLATLVRLLFFPTPLRRNSLQKVLVNLCENSRTRIELITLLLTILQDGTRDVSAVDKSFSQMSLRASKSLISLKDTPRRKIGAETPGGTLPHFPGESVPNLIAQRCLEALTYLVAASEQASLFFLTEQEMRRTSKKGKGKEKAAPFTTFPIIVLLGLLDRPALLKTQTMMDHLSQLLSTITRSLSVLQKKPVKGSTGPEDVSLATTSTSDPAPSTTTAGGSATAAAAANETGVTSTSTSTAVALSAETGGAGIGTDAPRVGDAVNEAEAVVSADSLVNLPPQIPPATLRLVVNILDAGECSSKTFQQTLILIQHLSYLPEARDIISDELRTRAQGLADSIQLDLDELVQATQGTEQVRGVTLAKFSPASASQAKLLRILKTIDWVNGPQKKSPNAAAEDPLTGEKKLTLEEEKVKEIFHSFNFAGLWKRLSDALVAVESRPELLYLATVLLPLIESLMVVSKYVFVSEGSSKSPEAIVATSPQEAKSPVANVAPDEQSMGQLFLEFTDGHKKILNTMVKNNPSLLSGSFAILVHNPKVLEFENKRAYFFSRLHDRSQRRGQHYGTVQVNVRRSHVFEDSFHVLQRRSGEEIKHGKLNVKFYGEEGVDAGGVTREWFSVLARQMFNPGYALFQPQAADALTYQPNKASSINEAHLNYFRFVGRIIGKALHDQRILEAYFSRSVYKHMLGKRIDHNDLESIDPEYHKSLVWMLENDIDGVIDLTFSVESDDFGVMKIVDLKPDGRNIPVTNSNKAEYVRLIADQRLSIEIKDQIDALLKGLYEIVPKEVLRIFSEKELELLISGLPEIDVDEWRANTDLHNFSPTDPVIGYFWRAVRSFTHEERAKLLQFVSGSSRVPLEGFASLQGMSGITKFSITSAGASKALPTAHTCFNQLDLPTSYQTYEELRKALLTSINEGAGSFGFA